MDEPETKASLKEEKMDRGLIKEFAFPIDLGRWVVERHWDLTHPQCPMALSPFHRQGAGDAKIYIEQKILTAMKYRELYGTAGHPHKTTRNWYGDKRPSGAYCA